MPTVNDWSYKAALCPFCGHNTITLHVRKYERWVKGWISCSHCECQGPKARELMCLDPDPKKFKDKIVALWNGAIRKRKKK